MGKPELGPGLLTGLPAAGLPPLPPASHTTSYDVHYALWSPLRGSHRPLTPRCSPDSLPWLPVIPHMTQAVSHCLHCPVSSSP